VSWIVEAIAQVVVEATGDEVVRRARRRRGLPELPEPTLQEAKKEVLWTVGLVLSCLGGIALLDGWPLWLGWGLVGVGLATAIFGLVVRRRMVRRERGSE
jgi:hypothetical protein